MINQLTAFTLNIIKSNLSLVFILYASGFLSFIAYYETLGLPYINGNAQIYAEMAGKNILLILETFIFLLIQPHYFLEHSQALALDRHCAYCLVNRHRNINIDSADF